MGDKGDCINEVIFVWWFRWKEDGFIYHHVFSFGVLFLRCSCYKFHVIIKKFILISLSHFSLSLKPAKYINYGRIIFV